MDVDIELIIKNRGGQQAGMSPTGMIVTHKETGISVTIPPEASERSQHKTREAALAGLEMTLLELRITP